MRFRVEVSKEAQKQLAGFPRDVRERIEQAIDELEEKDDSQWSNVKALQGAQWKGRLRKRVGALSDHFHKVPLPWRGRDLCRPHQIEGHLSVTRARLAGRCYSVSQSSFVQGFGSAAPVMVITFLGKWIMRFRADRFPAIVLRSYEFSFRTHSLIATFNFNASSKPITMLSFGVC